jgi:hypothetical protein
LLRLAKNKSFTPVSLLVAIGENTNFVPRSGLSAPHGFHRIRHYGLLASGTRADNVARARRLLDVPAAQPETADESCVEAPEPKPLPHRCPCCGGRMVIIETFQRGSSPRYRPAVIRIDTS